MGARAEKLTSLGDQERVWEEKASKEILKDEHWVTVIRGRAFPPTEDSVKETGTNTACGGY